MNDNVDNDASLTMASSIEATSVEATSVDDTSVRATSVQDTANKSATNEFTAIELPSKQNRVNTSQRAHKYVNNMPKSATFTLCN